MNHTDSRPPLAAQPGRPTQAESWLLRNALQLVTAMLVALFGWSVNTTMHAVADDISDNTVRLERLDESLRGVLVDQASHARRLEHLERRIDHLEARIEYTYQQQQRHPQ
jgi:sensor histidine kinase YesM